jgi:lipid-A-disaccharide synthase
MPRKIFIIACEPSGDSHGAHLVRELKKQNPGMEFQGLGGPKMREAGVGLLHDMTTISALGWSDVVRQYLTYRKIFYAALSALWKFSPDAVILIDSPAFNLRFAKKIRKKIPVIYYIAPQIWAWGGRRIHTIKKTVSKMLVILPFETEIYEKAGVPCEFVGHPLVDYPLPAQSRENLRAELEIKPEERAVGLFPGSRKSEVKRILPALLDTAARLRQEHPEDLFFLGRSPNVPDSVYEEILSKSPFKPKESRKNFRELVYAMDFALIASGTATLEAALLGTPFFLVYKASWTTYFLGKRLIRVPFLGLVNLLAGKSVVPEFIQHDLHPETMAHEAKILLENPDLYEGMKNEFLEVRKKLGLGDAIQRAAKAVLQSI